MIHLEGLSKVYPTANGPVEALAGVDLDVAEGEFVAVQGPSGCGKSTLLTIVGALGTATAGHVVVGGTDLAGLSASQKARFRASTIGFVFQTFHLLPYLTVVDNVVAAASSGHTAAARQRAAEILQQFQLSHRLRHRPGELSIGECQRVAIARALINRPRLILADEPTGNLDPGNAAGVLDLVSDFRREGGTVLLVTHDESAAARAQRTVFLRQGRVESR